LKIRRAFFLWLCALCSSSLALPQSASGGLQISPPSVDFGQAAVNSENAPRTVTVTNPTHSPITLTQILTSGIDFSEKQDCGQIIAPGAQCTIQMFFTPATSGLRTGNLSIMGSDPASPHFVALNGTGNSQ
jgi:transmembrane protein TMEM131